MYNAPNAAPPLQAPSFVPPRPARRYPSLRMVASTCVVSAWLTLILSILGGIGMMAGGGMDLGSAAAGLANPSGAGGVGGVGEGGGGNPAQAMTALVSLDRKSTRLNSSH